MKFYAKWIEFSKKQILYPDQGKNPNSIFGSGWSGLGKNKLSISMLRGTPGAYELIRK
jgi:hypothetical protein